MIASKRRRLAQRTRAVGTTSTFKEAVEPVSVLTIRITNCKKGERFFCKTCVMASSTGGRGCLWAHQARGTKSTNWTVESTNMNFKLHYLNLSLVVGIREFRVQFHKGTKAAI